MQDGIAAAASYYGVAIQGVLDRIDSVRCPLLLHVAEQDHLCPPEAQDAIEQSAATTERVMVMRYPGVGHAFARRGSQAFDAAAAERADGATLALLAREVVGQ